MIWTDVFQSVVMLAGLVIVAVTGSIEVGGLQKVWEINKDHGRINFFEYVFIDGQNYDHSDKKIMKGVF